MDKIISLLAIVALLCFFLMPLEYAWKFAGFYLVVFGAILMSQRSTYVEWEGLGNGRWIGSWFTKLLGIAIIGLGIVIIGCH